MNEKKRLLIATDSYYPKRDGVVKFLGKVIPTLTAKYEITILAPQFESKTRPIENTKIICLEVSKKFKLVDYPSIKLNIKNIKQIKNAVKEADIIFAQDIALVGALSIYYGRKYKKPVLNYMHQITWEHFARVLPMHKLIGRLSYFFIKKYTRYFYNKCTLILIPYKKLGKDIEKLGITTNKAIVKLGVNSDKFTPPEDKGKAKKKIGIPHHNIVIGYCGRISKEKDLATLRRAYSRLKERYKNLFLLIIGGGVKEEIAKFRSLKDAKVTGFVKSVIPYLQAMDIFIMPSLTETTSLATIEAMSTGLAVLTTKVGYIQDYILDKYNGLFFPKHNDYILSKKIEILIKDMPARTNLGINARKTVIQKFNWENTINDIRAILSSF